MLSSVTQTLAQFGHGPYTEIIMVVSHLEELGLNAKGRKSCKQ
jgi:hypothetical protein